MTPEYDKPRIRFLGFLGSTCEHRTVGRRAWCLTCSEWCYPSSPCCRDERMMQMADDRGTHFFGDGHDHGDPPASFVNDIDSPPDIVPGGGLSQNHALYIGAVWGIGMKHGLNVVPTVDDDGNYTNRLEIRLAPDITITVIVPEPPEGWTIADWLEH